jgi:hypothetical protein
MTSDPISMPSGHIARRSAGGPSLLRTTRTVAIAVAMAALVALPSNVFATGGYSQGATINITGAHLFAKVDVIVDVDVTCQPVNGFTELSISLGSVGGASASITERVGKTVATGQGAFFDPNTTTITCDGRIVHFQITVSPSGLVPFARGQAAIDASFSAYAPDFSGSDAAGTGPVALKIGN